jgi:uncharacterized protein YndB with AHSA1/START domain
MKTNLRYVLYISCILLAFSIHGQSIYWTKTDVIKDSNAVSLKIFDESRLKSFQLDEIGFKEQLANIPLRIASPSQSGTIISLPGMDGNLESFKIYEAPVLASELSARFPEIRSFSGLGLDTPGARLRMSVSHRGVQTMISYMDGPTLFMQAVHHGSNQYVLYDKKARAHYIDPFECQTIEDLNSTFNTRYNSSVLRDADDQLLRKFRLAISTTGEYTAYHGGTAADALAAINATISRVNAVYETNMAITFEVIANNDLVIFTDASTDPYSNPAEGTDPDNFSTLDGWNLQLQNTLSSILGNEAYDLGHLFGDSGGGGNAGCIGCVCEDDDVTDNFDHNKGAGYTSPADAIPEGDSFDIDFVAHEIGHQMGAWHTFSFISEGQGVNVEPGSGSTIMAYAGITGPDDVQDQSDPYFHYESIGQILDNIDTKTCFTSTTITNNPPVAEAGNDYTIPQGTAFILKGAATDPDAGDLLSYTWEQIDDGVTTSTNFGPTKSTGPLWRSRPPSTSPDRYMPILSRVLEGQLTETDPTVSGDNSTWETVSTIGREFNFALTVRDRSESVGTGQMPQSSFDTMTITVDGGSGPFAVTSQATDETWVQCSAQLVTWDVANTDIAPVNATNVNILLSVDGGLSFPFTLASNTANDGSEVIFYAVNSSNFTIGEICENFSLPSNNFTLLIRGETCRSSDNGSLDITALLPLDYTARITGNGIDQSSDFTSSTIFDALAAGDYMVCITVAGQPDYEICFNVVIPEPEDLAVLSRVDTESGRISLELSGGTRYNIDLNDTIITTNESEITLLLNKGINHLKISTDKDCQGTYIETINNSQKTVVFPNPILEGNDLNIYPGNVKEGKIEVAMYSILGRLLFNNTITLLDGKARLDVSNMPSGIYLAVVYDGIERSIYKVIKE